MARLGTSLPPRRNGDVRRDADQGQVMIASQAHTINQEKSSFKLKHAIWSLKDNRLAGIADRSVPTI